MRALLTCLLVLAALAALAVEGATAQSGSLEFSDFTEASTGTRASGTLAGAPISITGTSVSGVGQGSVIDGTSTRFDAPPFTPRLAASDEIQIFGRAGASYTVTFGRATTNPVLHIASLASELEFPEGTSLTRVSGDSRFTVAGNSVTGALGSDPGTNDGNGTVRVNGTFSSLTFSATPVFSGGDDGILLQAGAVRPPPPPPPPPAPAPVASFTGPPGVSPGRAAVFDAGSSKGVASFEWDINNDGRPDFIRPASDPILSLQLPTPMRLNVTLTVVGADGRRSTTTRVLEVAGTKPPAGMPAKALPPVVAVSTSTPAALGPLGACRDITVYVLLAQMRACFSPTRGLAQIPSAERKVVEEHYVSPKYPALVVALCARPDLKQRCEDAKKRYADKPEEKLYVSRNTVYLNGIRVRPYDGASVVVFPKQERIISSRAKVTWGGETSKVIGKVDINLNKQRIKRVGKAAGPLPFSGSSTIGSFAASALPSVGAFTPEGQGTLKIHNDEGRFYSTGQVSARMPQAFSVFGRGNRPPTGSLLLRASNTNLTPQLATSAGNSAGARTAAVLPDRFEVRIEEANLGGLRLTDLRFFYSKFGGAGCDRDQWKASGTAHFGVGGGSAAIRLAPPPAQYGVGLCRDGFQHAGGEAAFTGGARPQVFPGVFLNSIGFGAQVNPTVLRGDVSLSALELIDISGTVLTAFPSPRAPYTIGGEDAAKGKPLAALAGKKFTSPTVAAGGSLGVKFPVIGRKEFGNAVFAYSYPDYVFLSGSATIGIEDIMYIEGGMTAEFGGRKFAVSGFIHACAIEICAGADAWVTNVGAAVCFTALGLHPGAGYKWGGGLDVWFPDGCKPSRYFVTIKKASASQAANGVSFKIVRGEEKKHVRLTGRGGAPSVVMRGPDGKSLVVDGRGFKGDARMAGVRAHKTATTFLGVKGGRPGTYRIEPLPGSPPIASMATSRDGYDTNFKARVTGRGSRRVLHYDARKPGGQRVTFAESGRGAFKVIGTSRGGKGRIRFRPALGPAGRRQIVAIASLDGVPIPKQTLTRYRAPGVVRTGKPRRVRIRRKGSRLSVRWSKARGAKRYGVALRLSDGRTRTFRLSARRRSLRIPRVPLDLGGSVSVSAQGVLLDWGGSKSARFKRLRKPYTVLQTDRSNERRTAARKRRAAKRREAKRRAAKRRGARRR